MLELIQRSQIYSKVLSYLREGISLSELDRWIIEHLDAFLAPPRDSSSQLAGMVQRWLAELGQGHRSEDEIRQLLEKYIREHQTMVLFSGPDFCYTTSSNSNVSPSGLGLTVQREAQILSSWHRQL